MTLPVTIERSSRIAENIVSVGLRLKTRGPVWKTLVSSNHSAHSLVDELLPSIRAALNTYRDRSVAWDATLQAQIKGHAESELAVPPADWWAEYDAVRAAIIVVRNRLVTSINANASVTAETNGDVTWSTVSANTSLANGIQTLINTLD